MIEAGKTLQKDAIAQYLDGGLSVSTPLLSAVQHCQSHKPEAPCIVVTFLLSVVWISHTRMQQKSTIAKHGCTYVILAGGRYHQAGSEWQERDACLVGASLCVHLLLHGKPAVLRSI